MSYNQINSPQGFSVLPPVVKNLLIINGLFFLATLALYKAFNIDLSRLLGLHVIESEFFKPHQLVTHMFMHHDLTHILFNMFALWMFGNTLENFWGGKRFLIYYMLTGLGAGLMQLGVYEFEMYKLASHLTEAQLSLIKEHGLAIVESGIAIDNNMMNYLVLSATNMVGASGAVFGLLLAFGMTFPNAVIYLYFAIPIKAKYFVVLYGLFELFSGVRNASGDNVAHFAHLGGMFFGFFLILYWRKHPTRFH